MEKLIYQFILPLLVIKLSILLPNSENQYISTSSSSSLKRDIKSTINIESNWAESLNIGINFNIKTNNTIKNGLVNDTLSNEIFKNLDFSADSMAMNKDKDIIKLYGNATLAYSNKNQKFSIKAGLITYYRVNDRIVAQGAQYDSATSNIRGKASLRSNKINKTAKVINIKLMDLIEAEDLR